MGEPPAVLDGLTVTAGWADGDYPNHYGGGLYNPGGKLDVVNCTFRGNTAVWGGGIMNLGAPIRLVNTQLIGNRALMLGGGLYNYGGDVTLHNCRIVGNTRRLRRHRRRGGHLQSRRHADHSQFHRGRQPLPERQGDLQLQLGPGPPARRSRSPTASCTTAATRSGATTLRPWRSHTATSRAAGPASAISTSIRSSSRPALGASRASGSTAITVSRAASPAIDAGSNAALPADMLRSGRRRQRGRAAPSGSGQRVPSRGHTGRYGRV